MLCYALSRNATFEKPDQTKYHTYMLNTCPADDGDGRLESNTKKISTTCCALMLPMQSTHQSQPRRVTEGWVDEGCVRVPLSLYYLTGTIHSMAPQNNGRRNVVQLM